MTELGTEPLNPAEQRAVAVAAARFRPGSERYEGAKVGFLTALGEMATNLRLVLPPRPSPEWLAGYWVGHDVGQIARRAESRHTHRGASVWAS